MFTPFFRLLTQLSSRKLLSRLVGAFAKSSLSRVLIARFAQAYGIAVEEAQMPLSEYRSLNAFFTRRLKSESRPIDADPTAIVSPVDAVITGMGPIVNGMMLDVKGQSYTVAQLLQDERRAKQYEHGYFFVLYLSPRDYHRIHAPISGDITESRHLPGKVYPVNEFGLRHMPKVLSRNERLLTYILAKERELAVVHELAVVKVGALNVSSIRYASETVPTTIARGEELAYFEFGSTVVLLIDDGQFQVEANLHTGHAVKMGKRLGFFASGH